MDETLKTPPSAHQVMNHTPPTEAQSFVKYVHRSLDEEEDFHFLRFEFLQRLNLTGFNVKLARFKSRIQKQDQCSDEELDELQLLLRNYGK